MASDPSLLLTIEILNNELCMGSFNLFLGFFFLC